MNMQDYRHAADRVEIADHCRQEVLDMTTERIENRMDTEKKPIIRRFTGVAVAAAVLALNGALIYGIVSMKNRKDMMPGSAESELSVVEESAPAVTTEPAESETEPATGYAALFRQYFEWKTGEPQPYDYSDVVGTDLNETWEFEDCTARLHAAVSDGLITYFLTSVTGKTEDFQYSNLSFVLETSADQHQATEVSNEVLRGDCVISAERPTLTDPNDPQTTWRIYTARPENVLTANQITEFDAAFFHTDDETGYTDNLRTFSVNQAEKGGYFAVTLDSGENVGGYITPFGMELSKTVEALTPVTMFNAVSMETVTDVPVFNSGWNADFKWIEFEYPMDLSDVDFIQVGETRIAVPAHKSESYMTTASNESATFDETETTTVQVEFSAEDKDRLNGDVPLSDMNAADRSRTFSFGTVTVDSVTFDDDGTPRVNYSVKFNEQIGAAEGDNICLVLNMYGYDVYGNGIDITANENPDVNTQHCDADGTFRFSMRLEANYHTMPEDLLVEARLGLLLANGTDENGDDRGIYQCLPIEESDDPEHDNRFYITSFKLHTVN